MGTDRQFMDEMVTNMMNGRFLQSENGARLGKGSFDHSLY